MIIKNVKKIVLITLIFNVLLVIIKLSAGIIGSSQSLISDGLNSLADCLVSILLIIVLNISNKDADKNHPYGHEKYEGVMYLFLGFVILITSISLIVFGVISYVNYINNASMINTPDLFTLYIVVVALIIKLGLYLINSHFGRKYESSSLIGDSKNHLVDILATFVSLISIFFARKGLLYFEPIATIIIALFIMYTSITMIKDAISFLVDEAPSKEIVLKIKALILQQSGVIKIDDLKVRKHMNHFYVDVEIAVKRDSSLEEAHNVAESVHDAVELRFNVLHCMVHVNPYKD